MAYLTQHRNNSKYFRFRQLGQGPTVLLIGGDIKEWGEAVNFLSSYFTLIIPSFAYEILSKQSEKDMVKYLELIVEELNLEKFSIIAHSLGALTAVLFSNKNPHLVESIILSNIPDLEKDNQEQFENLLGELTGTGKNRKKKQNEFWYSLVNQQLGSLDYEELLENRQFKTLLLWGDKNSPRLVKITNQWKDFLQTKLNLKVFKHSGHFPMKDNPLYFSLVVKDFIYSYSSN